MPDGQLSADNRPEAGSCGGFVESRRAVDAVAIQEGNRGVPEIGGSIDERLGQGGTLKKAEGRSRVELDVRRRHNETLATTEDTGDTEVKTVFVPGLFLRVLRVPRGS